VARRRRRGEPSAAVVTGVADLGAAVVLTVLRVLLGQDVDVPTPVAVTACALGTRALPVLGEIVRSRGQTETPEAQRALPSAALLDGAVWLVLGVVAVSSAHSSGRTGVGAVLALAGAVLVLSRPHVDTLSAPETNCIGGRRNVLTCACM
jgi:Kef-type K+ transport system membrane component KefB